MNPISIGAILSALGVILGAFATHGLRGKLPDDLLKIFETGTHYLMLHAFAILIYGLWHQSTQEPTRPRSWPALLFLLGIVVFTGSLYLIVFTEVRAWGAVTPMGGVAFIAGWIGFAKQAWTKK